MVYINTVNSQLDLFSESVSWGMYMLAMLGNNQPRY